MSIDADALESAWQQVLDNWDDDQAHRRFLELSRLAGQLPQAGSRYRRVRETDPERRQSAERHIERLLSVAMAEMQVLRAPRKPPPNRVTLWVVTLAASLLLLYLVSTLLRSR